jgi:predicted adenine nucleotide alpha hydrolase (AANH) superfamily ATPase
LNNKNKIVFQALQYSTGNEVALKKLMIDDKKSLEDVEKEIEIMKTSNYYCYGCCGCIFSKNNNTFFSFSSHT